METQMCPVFQDGIGGRHRLWTTPEASRKLAGGANHRLRTPNAASPGGATEWRSAISTAPLGRGFNGHDEPVVCTTG